MRAIVARKFSVVPVIFLDKYCDLEITGIINLCKRPFVWSCTTWMKTVQ